MVSLRKSSIAQRYGCSLRAPQVVVNVDIVQAQLRAYQKADVSEPCPAASLLIRSSSRPQAAPEMVAVLGYMSDVLIAL